MILIKLDYVKNRIYFIMSKVTTKQLLIKSVDESNLETLKFITNAGVGASDNYWGLAEKCLCEGKIDLYEHLMSVGANYKNNIWYHSNVVIESASNDRWDIVEYVFEKLILEHDLTEMPEVRESYIRFIKVFINNKDNVIDNAKRIIKTYCQIFTDEFERISENKTSAILNEFVIYVEKLTTLNESSIYDYVTWYSSAFYKLKETVPYDDNVYYMSKFNSLFHDVAPLVEIIQDDASDSADDVIENQESLTLVNLDQYYNFIVYCCVNNKTHVIKKYIDDRLELLELLK